MSSERLNRFLARAGVASRRQADLLIAGGAVRVNGRRPPADGVLIEPGVDRVEVDGKLVEPPATHSYIALNKPEGFLVTADDPGGRPTVYELVKTGGRIFAVGRLDMDTHGLLLMTDDGELANRLAHPRYHVAKEYLVQVDGQPNESRLRRLRDGVDIGDVTTKPAEVEFLAANRGRSLLRIVIREGRNRQVRRMFDAIGHPVRDLERTGFGPLRLGRLKEGHWRRLRQAEVMALRREVKLD
ncbi:MAG: pseudouridine synthase [Candidatus Dormibacteraceae bacterium]